MSGTGTASVTGIVNATATVIVNVTEIMIADPVHDVTTTLITIVNGEIERKSVSGCIAVALTEDHMTNCLMGTNVHQHLDVVVLKRKMTTPAKTPETRRYTYL